MNEIAPKTYVQKSNIENDNLIDGKDILLGLLVSIALNAELASPARNKRTRLIASRLSVLIRSPLRLGISEGATTEQLWPFEVK